MLIMALEIFYKIMFGFTLLVEQQMLNKIYKLS